MAHPTGAVNIKIPIQDKIHRHLIGSMFGAARAGTISKAALKGAAQTVLFIQCQIVFLAISPAMKSAWRMASATIVSVGFSAAPVVNWLPSEMNRLAMS